MLHLLTAGYGTSRKSGTPSRMSAIGARPELTMERLRTAALNFRDCINHVVRSGSWIVWQIPQPLIGAPITPRRVGDIPAPGGGPVGGAGERIWAAKSP
jgi:hypothetical protein